MTRRQHQFTRRGLLGAAAAMGCADPFVRQPRVAFDERFEPKFQPSVLLIVVDQLRHPYHFDRAKFSEVLHAQNRIANSGVRFTNHQTNSTICSPSRASIYTGLYPQQAEVPTNMLLSKYREPGSQEAMPTTVPTVGSTLAEHGYRVGYRGKWHLHPNPTDISDWGFPDWEHSGRRLFSDYNHGYEDDPFVVQSALGWIERSYYDPRPWFLAVNLVDPHDIAFPPHVPESFRTQKPLDWARVPGSWQADLSDKPLPLRSPISVVDNIRGPYYSPENHVFSEYTEQDWLYYISTYIRLTEEVELLATQLLDKLAEVYGPTWGNTLVIMTSDHGDLGGAYGQPYKGIFVPKELCHVPMVASWPAGPVGESARLSAHTDIVPTIYAHCGVTSPVALPGADLRPLAEDPSIANRDIFLYVSGPDAETHGIVSETGEGTLHKGAVTDNQWPWQEQDYEFYPLTGSDDDESVNYARDPDHEDLRSEMMQRMIAWKQSDFAKPFEVVTEEEE